jgi:hypothetical protein
VSVKKPVAKVKDKSKTANRVEAPDVPKRKAPAETKEASVPLMDARSNKDRRQDDRRQKGLHVEVERRTTERRVKVNRRRQIDPTTCERDYSVEEVEFMSALDDYKRRSGRMFPTCSEILEVFRSLGYEKRFELPTVASAETQVAALLTLGEQAV